MEEIVLYKCKIVILQGYSTLYGGSTCGRCLDRLSLIIKTIRSKCLEEMGLYRAGDYL